MEIKDPNVGVEVFQISITAPSPRVLHGKECNEKGENPIGEGVEKGGDEKQ
jgi:hypothetical protein